ncbi:MAG: HAMP domain-containing histidine kinase [Clostridia bacterium]|jgi:signal transduction histidine kinase|nr:HAMP domain-containing histidine kinase [Clostridia bacterium]MCI2014367.1 HAMP domain-containing histidine kinase [Clostridia bacterium]
MMAFLDFFNRKKKNFKTYPYRAQSHMIFEQLRNEKYNLYKEYRFADNDKKKEIQAKIHEIDKEMNAEIIQHHLYADGFRKSDLKRYYRHIRFARPISIVVNLILWGLLFWFGGVSNALKIIILIFALASTIGSIFELTFLLRVKSRILNPVEELKKGVEEIANGNYNVKVESKTPNEISTLISAFNDMAQKLNEDEQVKTEYEENRKALIANISHDLKTPMTSIEGYIEALLDRDDLTDEKKNKYLKIIANNTDYMNRLIDDLFLFSKLDMQKLDFNFEKISVRPFLRDMMEELGLDFDEKHILFEYHDELEENFKANIDAKRFYQVIRNITGNAVKYGPKAGLSIKARLYRKDNNFCIDISDNGPGIPQEKVSHIFERFYRVDSERTKDFSGTGLGLAIARELAEAHSGRISVKSKVGKGTCFTIYMPILLEK